MQFGICGGPEIAPAVKTAGYDYIEINVSAHLKGEASDDEFLPILRQVQVCGMPCLAANVFVPSHLKITGSEVDFPRLKRYVQTVCARAERVGIQTIVFGSGGARKIPEGFDRQEAYAQLVDFGAMTAAIALDHGIAIAVEPLNRSETNVLNSVTEALHYVCDVLHPAIRLLVDAFHWAKENESPDDIVAAGPWLEHAHISTYANRLPPSAEVCNFAPFFQALRQAGYDKRLSVEAGWQSLEEQAASARQIMSNFVTRG
jgi:sugar phosphate isomerase/epimerase